MALHAADFTMLQCKLRHPPRELWIHAAHSIVLPSITTNAGGISNAPLKKRHSRCFCGIHAQRKTVAVEN
jgi:hypothetical protein